MAGGLARTPGLGGEARAAAEAGVELLDEELLPEAPVADGEAVRVRLAHGLLGTGRSFDLVVIHPPSLPASGVEGLAGLLRLDRDRRGFFSEGSANPFEPTATRVAGVFVAGAAGGPRPIREAIRDGAAAAGRVLATLMPGEKHELTALAAEIDPVTCGGCGTCVATCPYHAVVRDPVTRELQVEASTATPAAPAPPPARPAPPARPTPPAPSSAPRSRRCWPARGPGPPREPAPRIVAFLCEWCAYAAADKAGASHQAYPQTLLTVRVPCTGRVEPAMVLQAFREGADGVLVGGCHPGDCHHVDGNLRAAARLALLSRALDQAGIPPARLRVEWVGASRGGALRRGGDPRMTAELRRARAARLPAPRPRLDRGRPPRHPGPAPPARGGRGGPARPRQAAGRLLLERLLRRLRGGGGRPRRRLRRAGRPGRDRPLAGGARRQAGRRRGHARRPASTWPS